MAIRVRQPRIAVVALLLGGCGLFGPDCTEEHRSLTLEESFGGGFRAVVTLDETRNADNDIVTSRRIGWLVQGSLDAGVVTGIHLHQGQNGPILATLPIVNPGAGVFTSGMVLEPDFLTRPYDEFFEILRTQTIHVDLHTTTAPEGIPLGALQLEFDNDWFHPFCS